MKSPFWSYLSAHATLCHVLSLARQAQACPCPQGGLQEGTSTSASTLDPTPKPGLPNSCIYNDGGFLISICLSPTCLLPSPPFFPSTNPEYEQGGKWNAAHWTLSNPNTQSGNLASYLVLASSSFFTTSGSLRQSASRISLLAAQTFHPHCQGSGPPYPSAD